MAEGAGRQAWRMPGGSLGQPIPAEAETVTQPAKVLGV